MQSPIRLSLLLVLSLVLGGFVFETVIADDMQYVVSKKVNKGLAKAQKKIDSKDYIGALDVLDRLYNPDKLTEYEQVKVLNQLGFVYYNIEDMPNAIATYQKLTRIPNLEPQMLKQTILVMANLLTVEERYQEALSTLNKWFTLESNPAPEPYILKGKILYHLEQYQPMVQPIEKAMEVARARDEPVKEDWYGLLNFAYFQQENYAKVRDIQKILLHNWPKARYATALAGAHVHLGENQELIELFTMALEKWPNDSQSEIWENYLWSWRACEDAKTIPEVLPTDFFGSSLIEAYSSLSNLKDKIGERDPFETADEFTNRTRRFYEALEQFGNVSAELNFSEVDEVTYDLESEQLLILLDDRSDSEGITIDLSSKELGSYSAQNAMGAKVNVSRRHITTYEMRFDCESCARSIRISMPRDEARSITKVEDGRIFLNSDVVGIGVTAVIEDPYVDVKEAALPAKFTDYDPTDIALTSYVVFVRHPLLTLFDRKTRQVIPTSLPDYVKDFCSTD